LNAAVVAFGSETDNRFACVVGDGWVDGPGIALGTASQKALRIMARIATERINRLHVA